MAIEDYVVHDPLMTLMPKVLSTHRLEDSVRFSSGWVEVRKYTWSHPVEYEWSLNERAYVIELALSPRPAPTRIAHLGLGRSAAPRDIGRILMIPPKTSVHVSTPATGRLRSMHCALDCGMIENILQCKPKWNETKLHETVSLRSHEVEWLMLNMYRELRHKGFANEIVVESFATALAVELIRHFQLGRVNDFALHTGGLDTRRMRMVRERAYAEAPAPSLTELANLCDITVRQLSRGFKAQTGQTIGKFVEAAMVERARTLLTSTNLSIGEIARKLGFSTSASFTYAFRRSTGFRPREVEGRGPVR